MNIKIYYYTITIVKEIKYCFVSCKLLAVFFQGLVEQPQGKAMGEPTQNFTFHTATLYVRLLYAMSVHSTKYLLFCFSSIFVLERDVFQI
jgi:hypothetical protein